VELPAFDGLSYCDAADIVLPNFHQELWMALALAVQGDRGGRRNARAR
jgi:hypothetical protein